MVKDKRVDFETEKEYEDYMSAIALKIENKESLTDKEINTFCFALPYHNKKKFSFCDYDRFEYLYFHKRYSGDERPGLTDSQMDDFNSFISNWKEFIESEHSIDNKEKAIKFEYNYENKVLEKEAENKGYAEKLIATKRTEIIAYNKYIFQKGLDIFPHYKFPISFQINKKEVFLDESILFHSLIRHYGEMMKQTDSAKKSYFTDDVLVEEIYDLIIKLLKLLIDKKAKIENIISLRFEYKSKIYQIYTKKENGCFKVNSFFPLEDPRKISELSTDYEKVKLDDEINYYMKK